jgi:hypothetical protein
VPVRASRASPFLALHLVIRAKIPRVRERDTMQSAANKLYGRQNRTEFTPLKGFRQKLRTWAQNAQNRIDHADR